MTEQMTKQETEQPSAADLFEAEMSKVFIGDEKDAEGLDENLEEGLDEEQAQEDVDEEIIDQELEGIIEQEPQEETTQTDPNAELKSEIAELKSIIQGLKTQEEPEQESAQTDLDTMQWISSIEELDSVVTDVDKFNSLLSKVAKTSYDQGREQLLQNLPQLVQTQVASHTSVATVVDDFKREHAALWSSGVQTPQEQAIRAQAILREVSAYEKENPGMTIEEVLKGSADRLYSVFNIPRANKGKRSQKAQRRKAAMPAARANSTRGVQKPSDNEELEFQKQFKKVYKP